MIKKLVDYLVCLLHPVYLYSDRKNTYYSLSDTLLLIRPKTPSIVVNSIRTPDGTVLTSRHRHGYVSYTDTKTGEVYMVDGGMEYLRRSVNKVKATELSMYTSDDIKKIRKTFCWGVRQDDKIIYVPLCKISTKHLFNILTYITPRHNLYHTFQDELVFRSQKNIFIDDSGFYNNEDTTNTDTKK